MLWRILPHASVCIASDRIFLFDRRQDRYFAVPQPPADTMRRWLESKAAGNIPEPCAALLSRAGVLRTGDSAPTACLGETVRIPQGLVTPAWTDAAKSLPRLRIAALVTATWVSLRTRRLEAILAGRTQRVVGCRTGDIEDLHARAAAFDRARTFTPIARRCLLDSLALDRWLADGDFEYQLVFGVAARPFEAHCWLQSREAILTDGYDHVSRFTPIFVA